MIYFVTVEERGGAMAVSFTVGKLMIRLLDLFSIHQTGLIGKTVDPFVGGISLCSLLCNIRCTDSVKRKS